MDALVLPVLALIIVVFLAVVWTTWLGKKSGRALAMSEDDEPEDSPPRR